MNELFSLSLTDAVRRLISGEITSEAYTRSLLSRIDLLEPRVQAFQYLDKERALELARETDRRLLAGRTPGALHGVPVGVKDIIDVRGVVTGMGSPIYKANGWIGLEPAVMSVQLGMCLVAAVFLRRAVWKVLMITVALFCTVAGSGILIAAVGLFAMLFRRRRGVMRATGTALGIGAVGVMFTPFGQTFLDRATEINRPTTSTSLRVVDPYVELWPRWIVDSVTPLLGLGPGSSQREVKGSGTLGLLVPNPAKIFFDYGLIVGLVLAAFLIYVHLDSPSPSLSFTFFFSLWTVQASTTSMVLAANVLIVATLWSPRPGLPLDDIPASADPDPPRPRSPAAEVPP